MPATVDPLDPDQCEFYVVSTVRMDEAPGPRKSIRPAELRKIADAPVAFDELAVRVTEGAAMPV